MSSGFAVIPPRILHHRYLDPVDIVIYGELTTRIGTEGYCVVDDDEVSRLLRVSMSRLHKSYGVLSYHGCITISMAITGNASTAKERRISLGTFGSVSHHSGLSAKNDDTNKNITSINSTSTLSKSTISKTNSAIRILDSLTIREIRKLSIEKNINRDESLETVPIITELILDFVREKLRTKKLFSLDKWIDLIMDLNEDGQLTLSTFKELYEYVESQEWVHPPLNPSIIRQQYSAFLSVPRATVRNKVCLACDDYRKYGGPGKEIPMCKDHSDVCKGYDIKRKEILEKQREKYGK